MEFLIGQFPFLKKIFGGSWVTSAAGYIAALGILSAAISTGFTEAIELFDGDASTVFEVEKIKGGWKDFTSALAVAALGRKARDNDKSSESVGAKDSKPA